MKSLKTQSYLNKSAADIQGKSTDPYAKYEMPDRRVNIALLEDDVAKKYGVVGHPKLRNLQSVVRHFWDTQYDSMNPRGYEQVFARILPLIK